MNQIKTRRFYAKKALVFSISSKCFFNRGDENYKVFITVFLSLVRSLLGILSDAAHSTFAQ